MNFGDWEPVYETILADFGFPRQADERGRDALRDCLADRADPLSLSGLADALEARSGTRIESATVAVAGAGPSLAEEAQRAAEADLVFAASTAADTLREADVRVDCMVTDLDKNPETAVALTEEAVPVAAHAHGDNQALLDRWVPDLDPAWTLPTTQAAPAGPVVNPGGFTDGDRAAFLADELGVADLRFVGWDFDDPTVGGLKAKKLRWAARLLAWLEARRGERFSILDGRREGLDVSAWPR